MTSSSHFHQALHLSTISDGVLGTEITEGWDVRGNPHGGFLLALVSEAMATVVPQAHPLAIAATYLAPPAFGPAQLHVEPVRVGKRQSTASVRLVQDGLERVRATATYGQLPLSSPTFPSGPVVRPEAPGPAACFDATALDTAEGGPIRLHQQMELRLTPDAGWVGGDPTGVAEIKGWLRLADGTDPDPTALLAFSDGMPPSIFEAVGRTVGHVPTMQLTTYLFALPVPGWIFGQFRTRVVNGSFVGEDGDLWDESGKLVATTRQLALLVPPTS